MLRRLPGTDPARGLALLSRWHICLLVTAAASAASEPARLYDITTETGMPHLEENLRYAITRTRQCLGRGDFASAFPILSHQSLAGCTLREHSHDDELVSYDLVCESSAGTTGTATWQLGKHVLRGTLQVKLGGKNMTFYQRVTATLVSECPSHL